MEGPHQALQALICLGMLVVDLLTHCCQSASTEVFSVFEATYDRL
jgi:hypothetical protein